jgi:hypothetical protein
MALLGTFVFSSAAEMALEMATKDSVDSFPPIHGVSKFSRPIKKLATWIDVTFQYCCIARLDSKSRDVGDDLGAGLKDDDQHTDRTGNPGQFQPIIKFRPQGDLANYMSLVNQCRNGG